MRHPASFVETLLQLAHNELSHQLCRVQKIYQCKDGFIPSSLVNCNRLKHILAATWELRDINLALLQPGTV